ncbi:ABC multidrug transporter-like protein [Myriangium duriaei CBS 260.36]|uniref:ABC multidrug transporter-like protein n=1 Tax=Myriangium duriaei CBS 260.36 TaxID=1168546 RepID=A0A9P4J7K7_9PEZI|nr:ABC multidrug transporter-like protein [Myriangium duriaei CBS 260.36]
MSAPVEEKVWTSSDPTPPPTAGERGDAAEELTDPDEKIKEKQEPQEEPVEYVDIEANAASRTPLSRVGSNWTGTSASSIAESLEPKDTVPKNRPWIDKINPFKTKYPPPIPKERSECREHNASFLSKLTFQWMAPIMHVGYQRPLETTDIWAVNPDRSVDVLSERLTTNFKKRMDKGEKNALRWALYDTFKFEFLLGAACQFVSACLQILSPFTLRYLIQFATEAYYAPRLGLPEPPIAHGVGLVIGITLMQSLQSSCSNHFLYRGMTVGGQARAALIIVIFDKAMKISGRARAGGQALNKTPDEVKPGSKEEKSWFKKHLPKSKKKESKASKNGVAGNGQGWSNGRIVNLMSVDTYRVDQASSWFHMLWSSPIAILLTLVLLLVNLKYSALAGFALLVIAMPLLGKAVGSLFARRKKINAITDQRVSLTQEILQGVRFVKYFGWETSFLDRLAQIRKNEISKIQVVLSIRNAIMAVGMSMPIFAAMLAFITFSLTNNGLVAATIFSSLALFNSLRLPLNFLPLVIGQVVDASASIERIQEFLLAEEAEDAAEWDHDNEHAIVVNNGSFTWERTPNKEDQSAEAKATKNVERKTKVAERDESDGKISSSGSDTTDGNSDVVQEEEKPFEIKGINIEVGRKELIAVIGSVGSGKSSLLGALAGDMRKTNGSVTFGSSRAFCPQYAWIQNATVKENIIFGKEYKRKWYNQVIDACALRPDLEMLPNGDMTEIGERGITVSGGQKQRLNIARAIYFDADIVLMDDPLSAVDAHVGRHIMDNAICGLLKDKCRILATHQLHVLHRCDRIVWMQEGKVYKVDTFDNLMAHDEDFQHLMTTTAVGEKKEDEDEAGADKANGKSKHKKKGQGLMQAEERAVNSVQWSVFGAYIKASGTWLSAPIVLILLVISQGANIATSLWLSWWTSNKWGLSTGQYIGTYAGLGVLQAALLFAFSVSLTVFGTNSSKVMLHRAVTRVLRAPMSFFDTTPLGRITNRFSKDVDTMDNTLTDSFRMFFLTAAAVIAVFILIIAYFYYFAIALAPLFLLFLFSSNYYRASAREIKRHEAVLRSVVFSRFSEAVSGVATIRAYGLQNQFSNSVREATDSMDGAYFLTFSNQRWLSMRLDLIGNLLVFTTGILVVTSRFNVDPSIGGLVLSYILSIVQMIQFVVRQLAEVENNMNSTERIHYYGTELEEEAPLHTIPVRESWPEKGEIVFKDVEMRYRAGLPLVLKGLSLHVKPGERIGVVGRTGAGKSTIMSTLFRLIELSGGSITIDGVDIAKIGLADLRSRLSIIPQDPTLFRGTVRSNLDPFNEHTDLELWSALRQADLVGENQDINDHSTSVRIHLDSSVEEEGLNFSLGQRQLMALARALVRNSRIIVCDEATSSVDFETDAKIQQTIQIGFKGRTLLCIAHRLRTIVGYDRIIVMDQGRIAEVDTPRELYRAKGIFFSMCQRSGIGESDFSAPVEALVEDVVREDMQGEPTVEEVLVKKE